MTVPTSTDYSVLADEMEQELRTFQRCSMSLCERAAAALREAARLREALTYIVETRACYHDEPDSESQQAYFSQTCGVCRARAALKEPVNG